MSDLPSFIKIGNDLYVRPEQIGGIRTKWSTVSLSQGWVEVLIAGEWVNTSMTVFYDPPVCQELVNLMDRIVAAQGGHDD